MAYISKRDAPANSNKTGSKKPTGNTQQKALINPGDDEYDDDLDGDDEMDEDEGFRESLETEFPLSGGEADEGA